MKTITVMTILGWCGCTVLLAGEPTPSLKNLIDAIRAGNQAAIRDHLKAATGLSARDGRGNTPLHWAALANDERLVQNLLAAGADARATNAAKATALHYGTGNSGIVKLLLEAARIPMPRPPPASPRSIRRRRGPSRRRPSSICWTPERRPTRSVTPRSLARLRRWRWRRTSATSLWSSCCSLAV